MKIINKGLFEVKTLNGRYDLEITVFVSMVADPSKADKIFLYFFPTVAENISIEEHMERWGIIHQVANEMGFEDIKKIFKKLSAAYKEVEGGKSLSEQHTYNVVQERLSRSRNAAEETEVFNKFINAVIQKVVA